MYLITAYLAGSLISYAIIVNSFFFEVFGKAIADFLKMDYDDKFRDFANIIQYSVFGFVCYLFALAEKMNSLKPLTFVSLGMIFFLLLLTLLQLGDYRQTYQPVIEKSGSSPMEYFKNAGIFIFIYCNMLAFHQVYTTVRKPTIGRMNKIARRTFGFCLLIVGGFGMAAYFSLGSELKRVDLFPERKALPDDSDLAMTVLKAGRSNSDKNNFLVLCLSLSVSFIVNVLPIKENLIRGFRG